METGGEGEGGDTEGTQETPTASSAGDSSENATYVLPDNLTSLNEESGPHAMRLNTSWYSKSQDGLNPSEEPSREVSLQGNPVEQSCSTHVQQSASRTIPDQSHGPIMSQTRQQKTGSGRGPDQSHGPNMSSTSEQQAASGRGPEQPLGTGVSTTLEQQSATARVPDHSSSSEASPTVTQSPEAPRARSSQSSDQNTTSRHIRPSWQSGTKEEPPSSLGVSPTNVQPPGTSETSLRAIPPVDQGDRETRAIPPVDQSDSETRAIPPVDQGDRETRATPPVDQGDRETGTNQPADQALPPMPVSPPESSVPAPRQDTSELQSSLVTSEEGIKPAKQDTEEGIKPAKQDTESVEEKTNNQTKGGCITGIEMLIDHGGDDTKAIGIKEQILFELCPTRCTFRMKSIYGLLHYCLPDMEQWKRDKLMKSESRTHHETPVHNVIRELKNHGVTIGHAIQCYVQGQSKRADIVSLINKIHQCDFCAALKSK